MWGLCVGVSTSRLETEVSKMILLLSLQGFGLRVLWGFTPSKNSTAASLQTRSYLLREGFSMAPSLENTIFQNSSCARNPTLTLLPKKK